MIARRKTTLLGPLPLLSLVAVACGSPSGGTVVDKAIDTGTGSEGTDSAADTGPGEDSQAESDTATDSATDSGEDTAPEDTGEEPEEAVRFVALGDAGEGNSEQYAVADAIAVVCARDGCDFALYLGDNFYDSGVDDTSDSQWDEKFELPYAELDFPFYPVLGNHDYGGEGIGWELWKGSIYVDYTAKSDKWTMPDLYYSHTHGDATFYGLDTTQVFWGFGSDQESWLRSELARGSATWTVAYGHHPYISNGPHGNAGYYEGLEWLPIVNGEAIEDFVDAAICGQVDLYIDGHDHSLQWPKSTCTGTEFMVSGAGAKTTELSGSNATWFEQEIEGFVWIELKGRTMTGVYYDLNGAELYRRVVVK
jgi:tartrate-resistant acid phosphatase type 5